MIIAEFVAPFVAADVLSCLTAYRFDYHCTMNVLSIDYRSDDAGRRFARSLHETGFAVLRNHPVPADLLEELRGNWRAFFDSADKHDYIVDTGKDAASRSGFFPSEQSETAVSATIKDLKEFYHIIADHPIPPGCERSTLEYRRLAFDVGENLLAWLQDHTPPDIAAAVSEPFSNMLNLDVSLLRVLNYPPLDGSEVPGAVRAAAHEDINILTILPAANQPGLEVRDNAGIWHAVPCDPGTLVVNCGDMLSEATNDYYPSTTHRVVNPGDGIANVSRISIPFFLSPRLEMRLSDRYTAGEYLNERLRIINR